MASDSASSLAPADSLKPAARAPVRRL